METSAVRATACKAPRHRWHLRQRRHRGICNLQNLKGPIGFESHPLRILPIVHFQQLSWRSGFSACNAGEFSPTFSPDRHAKTGLFLATRVHQGPTSLCCTCQEALAKIARRQWSVSEDCLARQLPQLEEPDNATRVRVKRLIVGHVTARSTT